MERAGGQAVQSGTGRLARVVGSAALVLVLGLTNQSALTGQSVRAQPVADLAAYVDPFIGTGPSPTASYGQEFDGGDVFPGAAYPTGMVAWSPDTVEHTLPGGYFYPDRTIRGFSLTHFSGRGCTVYQDVPIMPIAGALNASPRASPAVTHTTFSHANEIAEPGFYSVSL